MRGQEIESCTIIIFDFRETEDGREREKRERER